MRELCKIIRDGLNVITRVIVRGESRVNIREKLARQQKQKEREFRRCSKSFPNSSVGKEPACNAGDRVRFLGQEDLPVKG